MFYSARRAQEAADAELSASRSGIDETEEGAAAKLAAIRDGLARGLSPQQIAAATPGLSAVSVNLFFTSFAKQARRSRKGGFTACANVFSPIPVTP